jgi:hypothetical protein
MRKAINVSLLLAAIAICFFAYLDPKDKYSEKITIKQSQISKPSHSPKFFVANEGKMAHTQYMVLTK